MGAVGKLSQHLALVIGRELIEEMAYVTGRRPASPAHRLDLGHLVHGTQSEGRLRRGEFGEYLRRVLSLARIEPSAAERITRRDKCGLKPQRALKLGDGRWQMAQRKEPFAKRESRFGDARRQRCRLAQDLQGLFGIVCNPPRPERS